MGLSDLREPVWKTERYVYGRSALVRVTELGTGIVRSRVCQNDDYNITPTCDMLRAEIEKDILLNARFKDLKKG